jgi:hypothetical protein
MFKCCWNGSEWLWNSRRMTNLNDIEELTQCEEFIEERSFKVKKEL